MQSSVINDALSGFRELLFSEIADELRNTQGKKVEVNLSIPSTIDEDRSYHNIIKSVYLDDESGSVMVDYTDDDLEDDYTDSIDCFSVDEILEIINAL